MQLNSLNQPIGDNVSEWQGAKPPSKELLQGVYGRLERLDPIRHSESLFKHFELDTEGKDWTYLPYGPFATQHAFNEWLIEVSLSDDVYFYSIINDLGEAVGLASYLRIDPSVGSIEVGHIHFAPTLQHTPLATEAMYLMMRYAFELGNRRYEWKCDALNEPSRRAALRLGMQFEGLFRQCTIYKGRNRDTAWFSILDYEWPAMKTRFEKWLDKDNFDAEGKQYRSLSAID